MFQQPKHSQVGPSTPSKEQNSLIELLDKRAVHQFEYGRTDNSIDIGYQKSDQDSTEEKFNMEQQTSSETQPKDPGEGLSWLKQVELSEILQNTVNTPFDFSRYVQTLRNPQNTKELITVQYVKKNITHVHDDNNFKNKQPLQLRCKKGHDLKQSDLLVDKLSKRCDLCHTQQLSNIKTIEEKQYFTYWRCDCDDTSLEKEKCFTELCCACYSKLFIRRKLEEKNFNHQKLKSFTLQPQSNKQHRQIDSKMCKAEAFSLEELEKDSQDLKQTKEDVVIDFAYLQPTLQKQINATSEHVIVAFWHHQDKNEFECYKQFRVDSPLIFFQQEDCNNLMIGQFLHSNEREIFYFQKEPSLTGTGSKQDFYISFIDLVKVKPGAQAKPQIEFSDVYELPLVGEREKVQGVFYELLNQSLTQMQEKMKTQDPKKPSSFIKSIKYQSNLLVFYTKSAIIQLDQDNDQLKLVDHLKPNKSNNNSDDWNLVFIDPKSQKVNFVVYQAQIMLKLKDTNDSEIKDVWILQQFSKIVKLKLKAFQKFPNSITINKEVPEAYLEKKPYEIGVQNIVPKPKKEIFKFSNNWDNSDQGLDFGTSGTIQIPSSRKVSLIKEQSELQCELITKWQQGIVQGMVHGDNDSRCTLVFSSDDWMTFKLEDYYAFRINQHHHPVCTTRGAEFVQKDGKTYLCAQYMFQALKDENLHNDQYSRLIVNFIDLDQQETEDKGFLDKDALIKRHREQVKFKARLPAQCCPTQLINPNIKLGQLIFDEDFLRGTYFYYNALTQQTNLVFLRFYQSQSDKRKYEKNLLDRYSRFVDFQIFKDTEFHLDHPIIVYKSYHPSSNKLVISNTAVNLPQKLIDLGPYKFICFVDENMPFNDMWRRKGETCVFFLVQTPLQQVRLMYYRHFCWQTEKNQLDSFPLDRRNKIQLVSGNLLISQNFSFSHIKKAILLIKDDSLNTMTILLQTFTNVYLVNFQSLDYTTKIKPQNLVSSSIDHKIEQFQRDEILNKLIQEENQDTMVPIEMLIGQRNTAFCTQRNQILGDEVLCIGYSKAYQEIKSQVVYSQREPILSIQLKYSDFISQPDEQIGLYLIDSEYQLKIIKPSSNGLKSTKHFELSPKFDVIQQISFKSSAISSLFQQLIDYPWQTFQISNRSILTPRQFNKENSQYELTKKVYNVQSNVMTTLDYLDYSNDVTVEQGFSFLIRNQKVTLDLKQIPWIGKHFSVQQEANFCYFSVQEDLGDRRIDLMNYQQQYEVVSNIIVLETQFIVCLEQDCLIFSQKDYMLKEIRPNVKKTKLLNPFAHKGNQYVEHDGSIWRYTSHGNNVRMRDKYPVNETKSWKEELQKIGLFTHLMPPEKFVSPSGTTYYITMLQYQKKLEYANCSSQKLITLQSSYKFKENQVTIFKKTLYMNERLIFSEKCHPNSELTSDEQRFVIIVIGGTLIQNFRDNYQISCTRDYLVINTQEQVYSIEKKEIPDFQGDTSIEPYLRNLNLINIKGMFQGELSTKDSGLRISCLNDKDFQIVSQDEVRKDVFQISFLDDFVMWDLNKQQQEEVAFLRGQSQFLTAENYVQTGFRHLLVPFKGKNVSQKLKDCIQMTSNGDHSVLGCPIQSSTDYVFVQTFKLFTMLDVYEMVSIEKNLKKDQPIRKIDPETIFTNIYGMTLFSMFYKDSSVVQLVLGQMNNETFAPYFDKNGLEFDNIVLRKLYRTVILPHKVIFDDEKSVLFQVHILPEFEKQKLQNVGRQETQLGLIDRYREYIPRNFRFVRKKQRVKLHQSHNLLQLGLNAEFIHDLDTYIDLVLLSRESRFNNLVQTYANFKRILNLSSPQVYQFLENSFIQTEMCLQVKNVRWNNNFNMIVVGSNTAQLSQQSIETQVSQKLEQYDKKIDQNIFKYLISLLPWSNTTTRKYCQVQVRILDIEWINKNLRDFFIYMTRLNNPTLYDNELIKVLLTQQDYSGQLVIYGLVPFCGYMFCLLWYFTYILPNAYYQTDSEIGFFFGTQTEVGLRVSILVFTIVFLLIELSQMLYLRFVYFSDFWNLIYVGSYVLNLAIICVHSMNPESSNHLNLSRAASISSVFLWFMLYYWMRLFPSTAFYVLMIGETLKDISSFLLIFFICICTFGNAVLILDQYGNNGHNQDYQPLIQSYIGRTGVDAWLDQYNLLLGNFGSGNYFASENSRLVWIYFILATNFTNIMFLNMLIAIMSDTYTRITQNKERYALKERTAIYADYIYAIKLQEKLQHFRYLYVVTPVQVGDAISGDWSGSVSVLQNKISSSTTKMEATIQDETTRLKSDIGSLNLRVDDMFKSMEEISDHLWKISSKLDQKLN